jgi:hypothetical protein
VAGEGETGKKNVREKENGEECREKEHARRTTSTRTKFRSLSLRLL